MKRVLVVDDEFDLTSTVRAILEQHGYQAEVCSSGREALECIRERKPDLLLLDVMIPFGNGYEVLEEIRREPTLVELPVVLMNSVPPTVGRAVQWDTFLRKPLSINVLLETVERLIGDPAKVASKRP